MTMHWCGNPAFSVVVNFGDSWMTALMGPRANVIEAKFTETLQGGEKNQCQCPSFFLNHHHTFGIQCRNSRKVFILGVPQYMSFQVLTAGLLLSFRVEITGIAFLSQKRERLLIPFLALQVMDFLLSLLTMFSSYIQVPVIISVSSLSHTVGNSSLLGWSSLFILRWRPVRNITWITYPRKGSWSWVTVLHGETVPTLTRDTMQSLGTGGYAKKASGSWDVV